MDSSMSAQKERWTELGVSKANWDQAEIEIGTVLDRLAAQKAEITEKYVGQSGMDRGAREHREASIKAFKEVTSIRKKYNIPEPE